jgi:hypothetical protein
MSLWLFGTSRGQVPGEVDPAALVPEALEHPAERGDQTDVLVGDDQLHSGPATLLERPEEPAPEDLVLGVGDIQAEDLPGRRQRWRRPRPST